MRSAALALACATLVACASPPPPSRAPLELPELASAFDAAFAHGEILGAQLVVGDRDGTLFERVVGIRDPRSPRPVDADTLFCIGSCSKPFAACAVLALAADGRLDLDVPIDAWLPSFGSARLAGGGTAPRAPTLRELCAHRGGIYSQRDPMTPEQQRLIRDFSLSLERSVDGIATQELRGVPGSEFAYSGAGYCVLGRVVEVATGVPFERVLAARVCAPLGLTRTTYFPADGDDNVASGALLRGGERVVHPSTPHLLGEELRLSLIGGSLYSTARETGRFARMVLDEGRASSDGRVLDPGAWAEWTRPHWGDGSYGLGWSHAEGARVLRHAGALAASRSGMIVDLDRGIFAVAHWTVVATGRRTATDRRLHAALAAAVDVAAAAREGDRGTVP